MPPARELTLAVVVAVAGAALVLLSVSRPWVRALVTEPGLPTDRATLSGRAVSPLVAALGLAALVGPVALLAARGRLRLLVGAVLAFVGAGVVAGVVSVSATSVADSAALRDEAPAADRRDARVVLELQPWRHVAAAGGLLVAATGLLTLARGRTWATMGRRFDAPSGATAPTSAPAEDELWERIERGDDPTA